MHTIGTVLVEFLSRMAGVEAKRTELEEGATDCSYGANPIAGFPFFTYGTRFFAESKLADEFEVEGAHPSDVICDLLAQERFSARTGQGRNVCRNVDGARIAAGDGGAGFKLLLQRSQVTSRREDREPALCDLAGEANIGRPERSEVDR